MLVELSGSRFSSGMEAPSFRYAHSALNPKVALFFLASLPQFVDPARGNPAVQVIALGLLFDVTGTLVNLTVAMGSSRAAERLRTPSRGGALLQRVTGVIFVALGLKLALASRP